MSCDEFLLFVSSTQVKPPVSCQLAAPQERERERERERETDRLTQSTSSTGGILCCYMFVAISAPRRVEVEEVLTSKLQLSQTILLQPLIMSERERIR